VVNSVDDHNQGSGSGGGGTINDTNSQQCNCVSTIGNTGDMGVVCVVIDCVLDDGIGSGGGGGGT